MRPSPAAMLSADLVTLVVSALAGFVLVFALLAAVEWVPVGTQLLRGRWDASAGQPQLVSVATPTVEAAAATVAPVTPPAASAPTPPPMPDATNAVDTAGKPETGPLPLEVASQSSFEAPAADDQEAE